MNTKLATNEPAPASEVDGSKESELVDGVLVGALVGFARERAPVQLPDRSLTLVMNQCCGRPFGPDDLGGEVALSFVGGDPKHPLILGKLASSPRFSTSTLPGKELAFSADRKIALGRGKSSITLTRDVMFGTKPTPLWSVLNERGVADD